jgi:hypothetical protein
MSNNVQMVLNIHFRKSHLHTIQVLGWPMNINAKCLIVTIKYTKKNKMLEEKHSLSEEIVHRLPSFSLLLQNKHHDSCRY